MARNQLDLRKQYGHDSDISSSLTGFVPGAAGPSSFAAPMDAETSFPQPISATTSTRDRLSMAFGTRGEDLMMGEAAAVPVPPGQDARVPAQEWGNHVSQTQVRFFSVSLPAPLLSRNLASFILAMNGSVRNRS